MMCVCVPSCVMYDIGASPSCLMCCDCVGLDGVVVGVPLKRRFWSPFVIW